MAEVVGKGLEEALSDIRQAKIEEARGRAGVPGNGQPSITRQGLLTSLEGMREEQAAAWTTFISEVREFARQQRDRVEKLERWLGI